MISSVGVTPFYFLFFIHSFIYSDKKQSELVSALFYYKYKLIKFTLLQGNVKAFN